MLALGLASSAFAQQNATLLLRSGERVSGQLVDLGGVGFTMNVNGQERRVPTNSVAVVDFAGDANNLPANEVNDTNGRGIVLNSGQTLQGTLYDIGGTRPLKITMDLTSGRRDFNSTDVRRIYLARPAGTSANVTTPGGTTSTPSTPSGTLPGAITVTVPANQRWVDTGITVRRGQQVTFNASGEVQLSADPNDKASPDGSLKGRYPGAAAMQTTLAGALIGRVGTSAFGIGNQRTPLPMPADGRLYVGINDDTPGDNQGQFQVQVLPQLGAIRR